MNNFLFDLQRFNDGVTEGAEPVQDTVIDTPESQEEDNSGFDFALDDDGNIVFLNEDDDEQPEGEDDGTPAVEQPGTYTPDEIRELGIEKLDPNRLPPELLPFYKSMQADYVTKTQKLAEQRKQFEPPQQAQPPVEQPPQIDPRQAQIQYYEKLTSTAKENIAPFLGPYDDLNPIHQAALADEIANIKVQLIQAQQYKANLEGMMRSFNSRPDWSEIDQYAMERLQKMPHGEAAAIEARMKSGDLDAIKDYLDKTVVEFEARKNPQQFVNAPNKAKPPYVEPSGTGVDPQVEPKVDYSKFGRATVDDQARMIEAMGFKF